MTAPLDDRAKEQGASLEARLEALKKDIAAGRSQSSETSSSTGADAITRGVRGASEFVAAILLGGAIGLGIDYLAGTKPVFTIAFFFVGVAAGIVSVVRAAAPKPTK
jgi:ATP synthase protein I